MLTLQRKTQPAPQTGHAHRMPEASDGLGIGGGSDECGWEEGIEGFARPRRSP